MKNLLKIFTLAVLLMLAGCETEKIATHNGETVFKAEKISFEKFKQETGLTNFDTSINIRTNLNGFEGRTADGKYELTDFDIETEVIKSMEFQQKKTYSLQIHPKDTISENFFNLIVYKKDNVWENLIIEMKPTPENLNQLQNGLTDNFMGQIRKLYDSSPPPVMTAGCTTITFTIYHCHGCEGPCDGCPLCVSTTTFNSCDFGGTGPSGGGPNGPSGPTGGGPSGPGSESGDGSWNSGTNNAIPGTDDIVIEPNLDDPSNILSNADASKFNVFLNELHANNLTSYNYLIQNQIIKAEILSYLILNDFSPESKLFARTLINITTANESTITFNNSLTAQNSLVFAHIDELQDHLQNFNNSTAVNIATDDNGNNTKTSRFNFDLGMFAYLNVSVKQKLLATGQSYSIENISSSISGATLAMEWHQNDDDDLHISGNVATVTFTGTLSLNCFIEGMGVFYSDYVKIVCHFNTSTGALISAQLVGLE